MTPEFFPLENAGWPAFLVDASGVIRRANQSAVGFFGPVLEGRSPLLSSIWSPENETTAEVFLARWGRSGGLTSALKFRAKDAATVVSPVHLCSWTRDEQKYFLFQIVQSTPSAANGQTDSPKPAPGAPRTDLLNAESAAAQKQKLECALQLARTVALDFNNALTSILGHTSLLLSKIQPDHPWRSSLVEVEKSAAKAAEIAHDLAAFSLQEKEGAGHAAGNLNQLLRRTVELFQGPATRHITWTIQLENRLYAANFAEAKVQQAFVKIIENSIQAVGEAGVITVRSKNCDVTEDFQDGGVRLSPGAYVCVEFEDSGCGIPSDVLPRIFEPFFTTKKGPNHRGLGLAWVYGIVTNHGGSVAVSSQQGRGTVVRVYLPAVKKIVRDMTLNDADLTGTQTILMIDDEDLLLTMGQMILSSYGYRVLTANNGSRGLEIFSQALQKIDLVITDLVMPKMSGRELIEHLRRLAPSVKIICSSGYVRAAQTTGDEFYLQKPFTSQDLLRKVKQVLSE